MLQSPKTICRYFNSNAGCRFGTNCKFLHSKISSYHLNKEDKDESVSVDSVNVEEAKVLTDNPQLVGEDGKTENASSSRQRHNVSQHQKKCFTFSKHGRCHFGQKCKYSHDVNEKTKHKNVDSKHEGLGLPAVAPSLEDQYLKKANTDGKSHEKATEGAVVTRRESSQLDQPRNDRRNIKRTCHFYLAGKCWNGSRCRFYHPVNPHDECVEEIDGELKNLNVESKGNTKKNVSGSGTPKELGRKPEKRRPVRPAKKKVVRSEATEKDLQSMRQTDCDVVKKRFRKDKIKVLKESDDGHCIFMVDFQSSDPDWPFDVKVFKMKITFAKEYPLKMFTVSIPADEQDIPETVRRYVEVSIEEWLDEKQIEMEKSDLVDMMFRPFIHWLDKSLEDIVTEGLKQLKRELFAKAAGFEFIPAGQKKKQAEADVEEEEEDSDDEEESSDESEVEPPMYMYRKKDAEDEIYTGPERREYESEESDEDDYAPNLVEDNNLNSERRGTEMRLRNLQMKENVASILYTQIKIVIQCSKCKNSTDILTPVGRVNMIPCHKCHTTQLLTFRPSLIHQFSPIMGYLDLDACVPFDLILQDSAFKICCLNCNKETKIEGMYPGQPMDTACRSCHQKLRVATEAVKFSVLSQAGVNTDDGKVHEVAIQKVKKVPKDPVIQLGRALPDDGTCKHYKKSYRWFRFPCCGKAYPCDVCHEDKENHEMVFANRIICGFCCKEQYYSPDKPCNGCNQSMTRVRTAHWEGGKGCRDKIKMSRNDPQKYGSINKTVSRKAQEKKNPSKKKVTKLRHASK